ncbi:hypothetical protein ES704_03010 [subsurface metagenome]|jgi:hypothetical protein
MLKTEINCINCKNFLKIGVCKYDECKDFEHFEPREKENKLKGEDIMTKIEVTEIIEYVKGIKKAFLEQYRTNHTAQFVIDIVTNAIIKHLEDLKERS